MSITLSQWRENPALASAINEDLQKPHWQLALALTEKRSPGYTNRNLPFGAIAGRGDVLAGQILGFEMALGFLRELALPPEEMSKPLIPTYGITDEGQATE